MKIHRFELDSLLDWLDKPDRKPLIMKGARQVGKSSLVHDLAQLSHRTCLTLNFERYPEHADFFKSKHPKTILNLLRIHFKQPVDPLKTLLFLDEIQATPKVIETLRYFYEEHPKLPIIAAGSLLEFTLAKPDFSMPVGRVEYFHLGPITFENFLKAQGEDHVLQWLKTFSISDIPTIPKPIHQHCLDLTKQFWLVGGMPEAVAHYIEYNDFQAVDNIKQAILQSYQEDFYKYGRIKQIPLLRQTLKAIPNLLGQKIKYTHIDDNSQSVQVKTALNQLNLAKIIHLIYHTHANGIPLSAEINFKKFKVIYLDIGLLCSVMGLSDLSIIESSKRTWINQGGLAEQFIGQVLFQLHPAYRSPELYYWAREKKQASAEIDYILQHEATIIPIEVKAGKTGHLKSLHYFIQAKKSSFGVRFNSEQPSLFNGEIKLPNHPPLAYRLLSLPFYLAGQLRRLCDELYSQLS